LSKFANLVVSARDKIADLYDDPNIGTNPTLIKARNMLQMFGRTVNTVTSLADALATPGVSLRTTCESPAIIGMLSSVAGTDREKFEEVAASDYSDSFTLTTQRVRDNLRIIEEMNFSDATMSEDTHRIQDLCHRIKAARMQLSRVHPSLEVAPSGYFYSQTQSPWLIHGGISTNGIKISTSGILANFGLIPTAIAPAEWVKIAVKRDLVLKTHLYEWTLRVRPTIEQVATGDSTILVPTADEGYVNATVNYTNVRAVFKAHFGHTRYVSLCVPRGTGGPRFVLSDIKVPLDAVYLSHFEVLSDAAGVIRIGFSFELIGIPYSHKCQIKDVTYYGRNEQNEHVLLNLTPNTTWGHLYLLRIDSQEFNDPNFSLSSVYSQHMSEVGRLIFVCVLIAKRVCEKYHQVDMIKLHSQSSWGDPMMGIELYDPNEWLTTNSKIFDNIEHVEAFYNVLMNILEGVFTLVNVSERVRADALRYMYGTASTTTSALM
jgi:hypothetical protein